MGTSFCPPASTDPVHMTQNTHTHTHAQAHTRLSIDVWGHTVPPHTRSSSEKPLKYMQLVCIDCVCVCVVRVCKKCFKERGNSK